MTWRGVALAGVLACGCGAEVGAADAGGAACDPELALDDAQCAAVMALALPPALPPARGNAFGDELAAAQLGRTLFFRADLGAGVACSTCHLPELAFTDRVAVSQGHGRGVRNAPTVQNAARLSVVMWDGRADALWSQPILAIENPVEMASSRLALVHQLASDDALRAAYEAVFGALPDVTTLPVSGGPGDPAWETLAPAAQDRVRRVVANVGKAFEAFLRRNTSGPAPLDAYLGGDRAALSPVARRGLAVFARAGCIDCHGGPMLTDEAFHRVAFPSLPGAAEDPGRAAGLAILGASEFTLAGDYADPPGAGATPPPPTEADRGALRTPSLRNVTRTAPYGHDGALSTLGEVLAAHAPATSPSERAGLLAFLQALAGDAPPAPWNQWPAPL